jgi:lysozyme
MGTMRGVHAVGAAVLSISVTGLAFLLRAEGQVDRVYLDPVGIPTVCAGHTSSVSKTAVGTPFSATTCAELLRADTAVAQSAVRRLVVVKLTQSQYDSLVSFVFNVGGGAFSRSTMLKKINSGDCHGAANEFKRYNRAGGKVLPGLTVRRSQESDNFRSGCP